MKFSQLPVGAIFQCNGNKCRKQSTRTAALIKYKRIFYFSKNEVVHEEKIINTSYELSPYYIFSNK